MNPPRWLWLLLIGSFGLGQPSGVQAQPPRTGFRRPLPLNLIEESSKVSHIPLREDIDGLHVPD